MQNSFEEPFTGELESAALTEASAARDAARAAVGK